MRKSLTKRLFLFAPLLYLSLTIISCNTTKKIKYFQDIPDSGRLKTIIGANYLEPTIQVDDILTILVETVDPTATSMINSGNISAASSQLSSMGSGTGALPLGGTSGGYLVDKSGYVNIPVLGKIKLLGLTTSQARDMLDSIAFKYYKDAAIIVRFANFKVSVTGEVNRPGIYVMPNEKVSVLDALSMAGDLTIFGKRENVLLIRDNLDGTKTPYRINLKRSDFISSPYYYLRQNDVIYVEPNKAKAAVTDANQARTYTIAAAALSLLIIIATRIKY